MDDRLLRVISWMFHFLGVDHPTRLAVGIMAGLTLLATSDAVVVFVDPNSKWRLFMTSVNWWGYITFGCVATFVPLLWKSRPTEYYEKTFRALEEVARRGGYNEKQKQKLYSSLAEKILLAFNPTMSLSDQRSAMQGALKEIENLTETKADASVNKKRERT